MKPRNYILLIPAAIAVSLFAHPNPDILYGFALGCAAAFAIYFWRSARDE